MGGYCIHCIKTHPHPLHLAVVAVIAVIARTALVSLREQALFCYSDMAMLRHRHILREGPSRGQTIAFYAATMHHTDLYLVPFNPACREESIGTT